MAQKEKEESVDVLMLRDTIYVDPKADSVREGRRIDRAGTIVRHKLTHARFLKGKGKGKYATDEDKKKAKVSGPIDMGDPPPMATRKGK